MMRIGIDLGGTKIAGVVMAPDGAIVAQGRIPSPRDDYARTLEALTRFVGTLARAADIPADRARVGMGTPGAWQPAVGAMKNCNSTWLNGQPLLTDLEQRLGPQVRLANDADCFALSEAQDGAGFGAGMVFGVILGTGVGGGLVIRGDLHAGPNAIAGEWGHTPLPYFRQPVALRAPVGAELFQLESALPDRPCYCGRYNCIETFLSGPGLAATHAALWGESCEPAAIAASAEHAALQTLALYREMLARSLAQLVNVLDPDVIVLGGGLSRIGGLAAAVADRVPHYLFGADAVRIAGARWGDDSGVRGAARLWGLD